MTDFIFSKPFWFIYAFAIVAIAVLYKTPNYGSLTAKIAKWPVLFIILLFSAIAFCAAGVIAAAFLVSLTQEQWIYYGVLCFMITPSISVAAVSCEAVADSIAAGYTTPPILQLTTFILAVLSIPGIWYVYTYY